MSDTFSRIAALGLLVTVIGTLAGEAIGLPILRWAAWIGLCLYMVDAAIHGGTKARGFMVANLIVVGLTIARQDAPSPVLADALDRAAFLATLFTALGMLREAAGTSEIVRRCGLFLAAQPPGRRYTALTVGGHLFSIILNFGAVSLLGALIGRSLEDDTSAPGRLRQRRMMTAVHRGFAAIVAWCPLTVSLAVVLTALPETSWPDVAPWCIGTAIGLLVLGWGMDRIVRPARPRRSRPSDPVPTSGSWTLVFPIVGLVAVVFVLGFALEELLAVRLVTGVMTAAPMVATAWLLGQSGNLRTTARRLRDHVLVGFPTYRVEMSVLVSAAFIGSLVGALLPRDAFAAALTAMPLPAWGLVAALAWLVVGLGQVGLNPVLSVSVIVGALPSPATLGLPPAAVAVALTGAWALTAASSPFGAGTLIIGQMTGAGAVTVGSRWNGPYALAGLLFLTLWVGVAAAFAAAPGG